MSKILDRSVTSPDKGTTWDFQCPGVQGSLCGDPATGRPFHSDGWPTKKTALARGRQHFDDHKGIAPMQELHAFREEQGLVVNDDGSVSVKDL